MNDDKGYLFVVGNKGVQATVDIPKSLIKGSGYEKLHGVQIDKN